jgi:fatty acid desaturase
MNRPSPGAPRHPLPRESAAAIESPLPRERVAEGRVRGELTIGLETEISELATLHWHKRIGEFCFFVPLAVCGVWLTLLGLALPGVIITALALNAFVLLMHEGMHGVLFASRLTNRIGSVLLGSTFLMSFSAYRVLHTRHHKYLGDKRDPDDYQNYVGNRPLLWSLHFMRLLIGSPLYLVLIPLLALKYGSDVERRDVLTEYGFLTIAYSLLLHFVSLPVLGMAWGIPLLIVGTLTSVRGFTQHGIADASDPYLASRTVLPNPVVGFFLLHENYHLEHHLFPEVPSYHLTRLHALIWPRLPRAVSGRSYLGFLLSFLAASRRLDDTPIGMERTT